MPAVTYLRPQDVEEASRPDVPSASSQPSLPLQVQIQPLHRVVSSPAATNPIGTTTLSSPVDAEAQPQPQPSTSPGLSNVHRILPIPILSPTHESLSFVFPDPEDNTFFEMFEALPPEFATAEISIASDARYIETTSGPIARELKRRYDRRLGVGIEIRSPYAITALVNQHGKDVYRLAHRKLTTPATTAAAVIDQNLPNDPRVASSPHTKRRSLMSMHFLPPFKNTNTPRPSTSTTTGPRKLRKTRSIPDTMSLSGQNGMVPDVLSGQKLSGRAHSQSVTSADAGSYPYNHYPMQTQGGDIFAQVMDWNASLPSPSIIPSGGTSPSSALILYPFGPGVLFSSPARKTPKDLLPMPRHLREMQSFESGLTARQHDLDPADTSALTNGYDNADAADRPPSALRVHANATPTLKAPRIITDDSSSSSYDLDTNDFISSSPPNLSFLSTKTDSISAPALPALSPLPETCMISRYSVDVFDVLQTFRGLPSLDKLADTDWTTVIKISLSSDTSAAPRDDPRFVIWGEVTLSERDRDDVSVSHESFTDLSTSARSSGVSRKKSIKSAKSGKMMSGGMHMGGSNGMVGSAVPVVGGMGPSGAGVGISPGLAGINVAMGPVPTGLISPPAHLDRDGEAQKMLMAATIERWIAQLTSDLNYDELLDFFLTYRTYIGAVDLCHLMICRFHWALQITNSAGFCEEKVKRVVRVRTFVAIRYWLLTFFAVDFVPNRELRLLFAQWLNTLVRDPILQKYGDAKDIVHRLIKCAKDCKQAHTRTTASSSASKLKQQQQQSQIQRDRLSTTSRSTATPSAPNTEPSTPTTTSASNSPPPVKRTHVLGEKFAEATRKHDRDDEISLLDLDFLSEEVPAMDLIVGGGVNGTMSDPVNAHLGVSQATALRPSGGAHVGASSIPTTSLSILQRTDHAPGPEFFDAGVMMMSHSVGFAPALGSHSAISKVFTKTIGRLGRWKRVLNSRGSQHQLPPISPTNLQHLWHSTQGQAPFGPEQERPTGTSSFFNRKAPTKELLAKGSIINLDQQQLQKRKLGLTKKSSPALGDARNETPVWDGNVFSGAGSVNGPTQHRNHASLSVGLANGLSSRVSSILTAPKSNQIQQNGNGSGWTLRLSSSASSSKTRLDKDGGAQQEEVPPVPPVPPRLSVSMGVGNGFNSEKPRTPDQSSTPTTPGTGSALTPTAESMQVQQQLQLVDGSNPRLPTPAAPVRTSMSSIGSVSTSSTHRRSATMPPSHPPDRPPLGAKSLANLKDRGKGKSRIQSMASMASSSASFRTSSTDSLGALLDPEHSQFGSTYTSTLWNDNASGQVYVDQREQRQSLKQNDYGRQSYAEQQQQQQQQQQYEDSGKRRSKSPSKRLSETYQSFRKHMSYSSAYSRDSSNQDDYIDGNGNGDAAMDQQNRKQWQFDVVSIDDLDFSDTSSFFSGFGPSHSPPTRHKGLRSSHFSGLGGGDEVRPSMISRLSAQSVNADGGGSGGGGGGGGGGGLWGGLRKLGGKKLPMRKDFEFVSRGVRDSVSSLGIIEKASIASERSSLASNAGGDNGAATLFALGGEIRQWQMNALIDSLSDEEEAGDVEDALKRLEGQINPQKQKEKVAKVNGWVRTIQERLAAGDYDDEEPKHWSDEEMLGMGEDDDDEDEDEDDEREETEAGLLTAKLSMVDAHTRNGSDDSGLGVETAARGHSRAPSANRDGGHVGLPPGLEPLAIPLSSAGHQAFASPQSPNRSPLTAVSGYSSPRADAHKPALEDAVPIEILRSRMPSQADISLLPQQQQQALNALLIQKPVSPHRPMRGTNFVPHDIPLSKVHYRSFILNFRAEILAQHFAMADRELFIGVKFEELVVDDWMRCENVECTDWMQFLRDRLRWKSEGRFLDKTTVLAAVRARFNVMTSFVISEIVQTHPSERHVIAAKFVRIAWKSYLMSSFNAVVAIITGLQNDWVQRAMNKTWNRIGVWEKRMYMDLKKFIANVDDFVFVRKAIEAIADAKLDQSSHNSVVGGNEGPGKKGTAWPPTICIPFIGIYLSQLRRLSRLPDLIDPTAPNEGVGIDPITGNFDAPAHPEVFASLAPLPASIHLEPLINVHKQRKIAAVIKALVAGQHLASRVHYETEKRLMQKCWKLKGATDEELRRMMMAFHE